MGLAMHLFRNPNKPNVVMTSRNENLGNASLKEFLYQDPSSKDSLYDQVLDITKKETYEPFKDWVKKTTFGRINILVNYAGLLINVELAPKYKPNLIDSSLIIATNYFSTRAFREYVLPLLAFNGKISSVNTTIGSYKTQGKILLKKLKNPKL